MEKISPFTFSNVFTSTVVCLLLSLSGGHSMASEPQIDRGQTSGKAYHGKMVMGGCYAARASSLLGEQLTPENQREIERLARARGSRITSSARPRDLTYSPLRLNIEVNGQNRIEDIYCQ
ncbi:I78 family peptidase inhibitor [Pseudomonas sp. NPDC089734]|uniref:I78 family peptidase inhibitor n=1 Tax=Pseudomonas sp. NPDC089734 TaxID=3364469 RepID=UPI00381D463B